MTNEINSFNVLYKDFRLSDWFEILEPFVTEEEYGVTIYKMKQDEHAALLLDPHDWSDIGDNPIKFFSIKEEINGLTREDDNIIYETEYDGLCLKCKNNILNKEYPDYEFDVLCRYLSNVLYEYELLKIKFDSVLDTIIYRVPVNSDLSLNFHVMETIIEWLGNEEIECRTLPPDIFYKCLKALKYVNKHKPPKQKISITLPLKHLTQ